MKKCTACGATKPIEEFGVDRARRDGRASRCRPCRSALEAERQRNSRRGKKWPNLAAFDATADDDEPQREVDRAAQARAEADARRASSFEALRPDDDPLFDTSISNDTS